MAVARSSSTITYAVWRALFLREAVQRISGNRVAWLWLLLEPIIHVAFVMFFFEVVPMRTVPGADAAMFLMTGLLSFFMTRNTAPRSIAAISSNMALFAYRQVKPVDTVLMRAALEGYLLMVVLLAMLSGAGLLGYEVIAHDPLEVLAALIGLWLCGLGLGLVFSVAGELLPEFSNVLKLFFMMFMNMSAYLFKDGYDDLIQEMRVLAQTLQLELRQAGADGRAVIERRVAANRAAYPDLAIALVPVSGESGGGPPVTAGPWWHLDPPREVPAWVRPEGFAWTLAFAPADAPQEHHLLIRTVEMPPPGGAFAVIVDLPVMGQVVEHLGDLTSIRAGALTIQVSSEAPAPQTGRSRSALPAAQPPAAPARPVSLYNFQGSVAVLEFTDWATGRRDLAFLSLSVRLRDLYDRISAANGGRPQSMSNRITPSE